MSARAQTASPPDTAKVRLIRKLVATAHLTDQALQVIEQAIPAQRVANPRIPAEFWDRFLTQARVRRGELEDAYVALYDRNFTTAELRGMIAFYESPIGKRFLEVQPVLMREGMVMGQEWGTGSVPTSAARWPARASRRRTLEASRRGARGRAGTRCRRARRESAGRARTRSARTPPRRGRAGAPDRTRSASARAPDARPRR